MKFRKIILLFIALQFIYSVSNAQIKLVGNITTNGVASYPTHIDSLGRGGYMSLPTIADRDAIPTLRRKYGMLVFVQADGVIYKLNAATLVNTDWVALALGSSGSQYTDALARSATSLTVTGSSGAATYSSTTGVFNIPNYTLAGLAGSQTANTFYAAPNGSNGTPDFRNIVAADIPTLNQSTTGNAATVTTNANLTGNVTSIGNATTIVNGVVTNAMLAGSIDLTSKVTGALPVANGGTGATTLTGVLKGNGTSALTAAAAGTDYQAPITLTTSGSGAATFSGTTLNIPSYTLSGLGGVPYTGATGAVNLGAYDLSVNGLTIGKGAGVGNGSNTAIGINALVNNTDGSANTASGSGSLRSNTTGVNNTATGVNALFSNTTGDFNTSSGVNALYGNTTGYQNTASGFSSLAYNTTGFYNTASGFYALFSNNTGSNNTASGYFALKSNTSGANNTAFGYSALNTNLTGSNLTALGNGADVSVDGLTNATAIGNGAIVAASNSIQLGNGNVTNVKTSGTITAGTITYPNTAGTNGYYLKTDGTGTASWAAVSGGASTVGSISGSSNVNGATISGATLTLTPADASNGGIVTTGVQTFAGAKTFNNDVTGNNNPKISGFSANINPQTNTTYTLAASDNGKIITLNNSGSITLTLPVLTAGFNCMIIQSGEGVVTLTGSSTTISNKNSFTKTAGVNSVVTVIYLTANTAITIGDMTN